ncbi:MAG: ROK family protein [Candidatus Aureabacteria bacterium]|nr:ROK family protein [Candidatus Auribacterota bacterium]
MMRRCAIGVDIGGTTAKLALVTERAAIVARATVDVGPRAHPEEVLREIAGAAMGLAGNAPVAGMGIGCAGCVDHRSGVVHFSPNLPRWREIGVRSFMEKATRMRCMVDNDVNMMTMSELRYGAARGARNACCLTIGTGVGGGLVIDGRLYRGSTMSAGEFGHVTVDAEGYRCGCGNRGCAERYLGLAGIVRLARRAMAGRRSTLSREGRLTPRHIALAARRGDPAAKAVWRRAGYYLGVLLVGIVNVFDPDVIAVGGGIANAGELLLAPARRLVREQALPVPGHHVRIVRAALGEDSGAIGAASAIFSADP